MKLVTNNFKLTSAQQFVSSFATQNTSTYYIFSGRSYPFANDNNLPVIYDNSENLVYDAYDDMLHGKRLSANDVCLMIKRYDWSSNTVYERYDDQSIDLLDSKFYVVNSNNAVFKCLNNNNGAPSTVEPTVEDATDEIYIEPGDGYQWKYMYTANAAIVTKFATREYFPLVENTNVSGNAVSGAIEVLDLEAAGDLRYVATTSGTIQETAVGGNDLVLTLDNNASSTTNFYNDSVIYLTSGTGAGQQRKIVQYDGSSAQILIDSVFDTQPIQGDTEYIIVPSITINGDGIGARARAVVNTSTNIVEGALVTDRGINYSYATITVQGYYTGSANSTNQPQLRFIKPPAGGHGKNQAAELGAHWVGISSSLVSTASGGKIVDENDFRIVGVIKNPRYREVLLDINSSYLAADFQVSERVTQVNTNATGVITNIYSGNNTIAVSNVVGIFNTTNIITGGTSLTNATADTVTGQGEYFNQTLRLECENKSNVLYFLEDTTVYQPGREGVNSANGLFYSSSNTSNSGSTTVRLTHTRGTFNNSDITTEWLIEGNTSSVGVVAQAKVISQVLPDFVYGSGEVLYIENMFPITRNTDQTETFKFIFEF
jgi:hypothetical protein